MKAVNLKYIKKQRSDLKITLQEMATELGFKNASTYMKYENGDYIFKANHLPVVARMLGCDIKDLFTDTKLP